MLQRIAERLARLASWPRVGLLLVLYVALISLMTGAENRIKALSGGLGVPDLMRFFTPDELYARLSTFGDEGRRIYLGAEVVDLFYPLVYTALFASVLALAIRRRFGEQSRLLLLCLLPVAGMLCDYLENAGFFTVLLSWPAQAPAAARLAATGNAAKWSVMAVVIPLAALALLDTAVQGLRGRLRPQSQ